MGLLGLPDDFDTIPVRKQLNEFIRSAQREIKPDKCILCGHSKTSYCNSHSVPQMILRSIADSGKVLQANAVIDTSSDNTNARAIDDICHLHYSCFGMKKCI